jgi:hypothetical protein
MNLEFGGASARSARISVIRDAVIYTPLFIAGMILTALSLARVLDAGPILTLIEIVLTVLFGYQSIQALRDINAELIRTEGRIGRHWNKLDFFITHSYYISVSGKIFRIPAEDWHLLEEDDRVAVTHYPHSGAVAGIEHLPHSDPAEHRSL